MICKRNRAFQLKFIARAHLAGLRQLQQLSNRFRPEQILRARIQILGVSNFLFHFRDKQQQQQQPAP